MTNELHAPAAPSSLDRIAKCSASLLLGLPYLAQYGGDTEATEEGKAAHWVSSEFLSGRDVKVGSMTPQQIEVDEDMILGAALYADTCGGYGFIETPVTVTPIHPTHCWGTPDWFRWDPIANKLRVVSYKYGHKFVEVYENWQEIAYAIGILDLMEGQDDCTVEITIVQPRCYVAAPVRVWETTAHDLVAYGIMARYAVERALVPGAKAVTGEHCEFCPGRHVCQTFQRSTLSIVDMVGMPEVLELSPEALGAELLMLSEAAERIDARRVGLKVQAESILRAGGRVPNYHMAPTRGRTVWTVPAEELTALEKALNLKLFNDPKPITPRQAGLAGLDASLLTMYSKPQPGALQVTRDDPNHSRKVFTK